MTNRTRHHLPVVLGAGLLASCISLAASHTRTVPGDPLWFEDQAERAFMAYEIPLVEHADNYRVRSGPFIAHEAWGVERTEQRLHCQPRTDGLSAPMGDPVELSITVRISRTGIRPTRVSLDSEGRTVQTPGQDGASRRCRLSYAFAEELLTAIAGPEDEGSLPGITPPRPPGGAGTRVQP